MPKFLCDAMLGSLARWLRFFGYDCLYIDPSVDDSIVLEEARADGRWLLTRDQELAAMGPRTMLVRNEELEAQLREVFGRHELRPEPNLAVSRCSECNGTLHDVEAEKVADRVPPYVIRTAPRFRECTSCGRVYWPGTHTEKILRRMERVMQSDSRPG
jgi:uncharacterized protein with PIN domain